MKREHTDKTRIPVITQPQSNTEDKIRSRAYEIYEARGYEPGHDLDDWLAAEAEMKGNIKPVAA